MTAAISPDPVDALDHRLRMQLLVDTSCEIGEDPEPDIIAAIRDRLSTHYGGTTCAEVLALLWAAAVREPEQLAEHVHDVYRRQQQVEQHGATSGHDVCCLGECQCIRLGWADRCERCEDQPNDRLDEALRALLVLLEQTVSRRAVKDMIGSAA